MECCVGVGFIVSVWAHGPVFHFVASTNNLCEQRLWLHFNVCLGFLCLCDFVSSLVSCLCAAMYCCFVSFFDFVFCSSYLCHFFNIYFYLFFFLFFYNHSGKWFCASSCFAYWQVLLFCFCFLPLIKHLHVCNLFWKNLCHSIATAQKLCTKKWYYWITGG